MQPKFGCEGPFDKPLPHLAVLPKFRGTASYYSRTNMRAKRSVGETRDIASKLIATSTPTESHWPQLDWPALETSASFSD